MVPSRQVRAERVLALDGSGIWADGLRTISGERRLAEASAPVVAGGQRDDAIDAGIAQEAARVLEERDAEGMARLLAAAIKAGQTRVVAGGGALREARWLEDNSCNCPSGDMSRDCEWCQRFRSFAWQQVAALAARHAGTEPTP